MSDIAWRIASLSQLSVLLEVSSPKPGNVNRLRAFSDTGYRHFLASAALLGHGLYISSERGVKLALQEITPQEVGLGELILECSEDVFGGLNRRNTILGTILLYIPIVVGASATIQEMGKLSIPTLKKWVRIIIDSSTIVDTLNVYKAFHLANPGGDMNREVQTWSEIHERYDINNPHVMKNIERDNVTLKQLFNLSSEVESLSKEWSSYFQMTLNEVYPYLDRISDDLEDLEEGIVRTFLWLLSKQPDGLIIKKVGLDKAKEIQSYAQKIVESTQEVGEISSLLADLDGILRSDGNRLNPGTTADIISLAILLKLIKMDFSDS
ncbi:MAG: triphosphoribosyl-dephospho-CoA synthase [Candidatus Thorarchaeota archaeon]